MLRMLKVRAGARVLEIGTGSGYSTALLAVLTGSKGRVTSIDIDPEVVERARKRVTLHGLTHMDVQCADGRRGYAPAAPYGRIVAWAALRGDVPRQWLAQLQVGGAVVVPRPGTGHATRFQLTQQGFVEDARLPASFVPMSPVSYRPWETGCGTEPPSMRRPQTGLRQRRTSCRHCARKPSRAPVKYSARDSLSRCPRSWACAEDRSEPIRQWVSEDRRSTAARWGAWAAKIRRTT